jgi:hypothetical protein
MKNQHTSRQLWRRWVLIALAPLAAIVFALALTLPALADTVYNITFPVSFSVVNPCNGETVVVSGNEHDTLHMTMDGNGGFHGVFHMNLQDVSGVGDQGNTYRIPATFHDNINGKVGEEETLTATSNVISQGSAPNFLLHDDTHITVHPDGTVTSSHDNFRTECRG